MVGRAGLAALSTLFGTLVGLLVVPALLPDVVPDAHAARPSCTGQRATVVGTPGNDVIIGTAGPDVIVTRAGNDVVRAGAGNDVICSGAGDDRVVTGGGDDVVLAGRGDDFVTSPGGGVRVDGGPGDETVDIRTGPRGHIDLVGGRGLNLLTLTVRDAAGPVAIRADQAARTISIGTETGAFGDWALAWFRGAHRWSYLGTTAPDSIIAVDGSLRARVRGGNDVVTAGAGDDRVDGGAGRRDAAAVIGGANTCARVEYGDCGRTVRSPTRPVLARGGGRSQPSSALRAASTSA